MTNLTPFELYKIRLTGLLYGFAYFTTQRGFLGVRLSGWLKGLIIIFTSVAWFGGWPRIWVVVGLIGYLAVQLIYWLVKRQGYLRFRPVDFQHNELGQDLLADNQKLEAFATGTFSVSRRQAYVLQKPAKYWRVPIGDHAFMVEHEPGKFLYQFVQAGSLQSVEVGLLIFDRRPRQALAVTFLTTWGPEFGDNSPRRIMSGGNHTPAKLERTIYLTFENTADRQLVHQNLLRDVGLPLHKPA